ncbi:MAG: hypothetical protein MJK08_05915 [Campylobacterales bacterium]|nr:hypothetical protein [Campylobacterales bacterium]
MFYIDILNYFKNNSKHYEFMGDCLNHIQDLNIEIGIDDNFISTVYKLSNNKEFDFYVSLNEYFNTTKQATLDVNAIEYTTKLLFSISTIASFLHFVIPQSIPKSSFLIHSAVNYDMNKDLALSKYNEKYPNAITSLVILEHEYPSVFSLVINVFISNLIDYSNRYSTEFDLINGYLEDLENSLDLEDILWIPFYTTYFCKMFEWCIINKHEKYLYYYEALKIQSEIIKSKGFDKPKNDPLQSYANYVNIETTLMSYRRYFENTYTNDILIDFYNNNKNNLNFKASMKLLTELFMYVDKEKYLDIIKDKINSYKESSDPLICNLIYEIEVLDFNVLSPYLLYLANNTKEDFNNFLHETYNCSLNNLEKTIFFMHSTGLTYINDSTSSKMKVSDEDLHYNLIHYINDLFTLGITVQGESEHQRLFYKLDKNKENKPNLNKVSTEKKFLDSIYKYYYINSRELDINYKYIFLIQHIRVPLQQIIYKKYNKLFPIIKFNNKINVEEKKIKKVIHLTLDTFSTNAQEEEIINYLNKVSEITFEYKYVTNKDELKDIMSSDDYAVISISSHGEINTRAPLENKIKIGDSYISFYELDPNNYTLSNKRLLYLNICDSGHYSCKNGFMMESLSTFLTHNNQATVSHMWPVTINYPSSFLMIFFHHLMNVNSFEEAYSNTLSLAVNYNMHSYIENNNLQSFKLFETFLGSSVKKESVINWGSMIYQE